MRMSEWSSDVCSSDLMGGLSRSRLCPRADRPCHARDGRGRRTALPAQLCRQCGRDRALRIAGLPHPAAGACAGDRAVIDRRTHLAALVAFAAAVLPARSLRALERSEEHTSELQSLMRISYAVFCLKKKNKTRKLSTMTIYK